MNLRKRFKKWLKTTQAKQLFSLCRWLHIYISMALFSLLLFFSVTGITLNHPQWAAGNDAQITELQLPTKLAEQIASQQEVPIKAIQQFVEQQTGLSGPRNIDFMPEEGEISYDYPIPAGYAFITVFLHEGVAEMEQKQGGMLALLNDLHKGRHSGSIWSWLLDLSAGLILLFSVTGLVILLQNAKHRKQAFVVLLLGTMTPVIIYLISVPRLI